MPGGVFLEYIRLRVREPSDSPRLCSRRTGLRSGRKGTEAAPAGELDILSRASFCSFSSEGTTLSHSFSSPDGLFLFVLPELVR